MKTIVVCEVCGKESFAEGDCPNEIMQDSGYIQDDDDWSIWFCSKECADKHQRDKE